MTTFRIEAGGKTYRVDAPSPEAAAAAVEEMMKGAGGGAPAPASPPSLTGASPAAAAAGPVRSTDERGSLMDSIMQGVTFGTSDEIAGAFGGAMDWLGGGSFGEGYDRTAGKARENLEAYRQRQPVWSTVGEVGGAVATLPVAGPLNVLRAPAAVSKAAPLLTRAGNALARGGAATANSAATGAAYGGLYGAGSAEGTLADRAGGALEGAALGGALGAAAPSVIGGVKAAGRAIGAGLGYPMQAARSALRPASGAERRVVRAAEMDIGDPNKGVGVLRAAQGAGAPMAPLDFGEATRQLGRAAKNASPEAASILNRFTDQRFESQGERAIDIITRLAPGVNAPKVRQTLEAAARAANKPAYDRAMNAPAAQSVWGPELAQLTRAPALQAAMMRAVKTGANKAAVSGAAPPKAPFVQNPDGTLSMVPGVTPNLRFWDAAKQELDDMIGDAIKKGEKGLANDLRDIKRGLVTYLDNQVPAYKTAREGAAGFFGAEDALEAGETFVTSKLGNAEARDALAKMTPAERQLFAEGFATRLVRTIMEAGDRRAITNASIFRSPAARERLEIALGPGAARDMEAFLLAEDIMDMGRRAVQGNSTTAQQLIGQGLLSGGAGLYAGGGDPTNPATWITAAITGAGIRGVRRGVRGVDAKVAREVADMLTSKDPQRFKEAVDRIGKNPGLLAAFRSAHDRLVRALMPATGGGGAPAVPVLSDTGAGPANADE